MSQSDASTQAEIDALEALIRDIRSGPHEPQEVATLQRRVYLLRTGRPLDSDDDAPNNEREIEILVQATLNRPVIQALGASAGRWAHVVVALAQFAGVQVKFKPVQYTALGMDDQPISETLVFDFVGGSDNVIDAIDLFMLFGRIAQKATGGRVVVEVQKGRYVVTDQSLYTRGQYCIFRVRDEVNSKLSAETAQLGSRDRLKFFNESNLPTIFYALQDLPDLMREEADSAVREARRILRGQRPELLDRFEFLLVLMALNLDVVSRPYLSLYFTNPTVVRGNLIKFEADDSTWIDTAGFKILVRLDFWLVVPLMGSLADPDQVGTTGATVIFITVENAIPTFRDDPDTTFDLHAIRQHLMPDVIEAVRAALFAGSHNNDRLREIVDTDLIFADTDEGREFLDFLSEGGEVGFVEFLYGARLESILEERKRLLDKATEYFMAYGALYPQMLQDRDDARLAEIERALPKLSRRFLNPRPRRSRSR